MKNMNLEQDYRSDFNYWQSLKYRYFKYVLPRKFFKYKPNPIHTGYFS